MNEQEIADYLDLMLESIKLLESRFLKIRPPGVFVRDFGRANCPYEFVEWSNS